MDLTKYYCLSKNILRNKPMPNGYCLPLRLFPEYGHTVFCVESRAMGATYLTINYARFMQKFLMVQYGIATEIKPVPVGILSRVLIPWQFN